MTKISYYIMKKCFERNLTNKKLAKIGLNKTLQCEKRQSSQLSLIKNLLKKNFGI